LPRTTIVGLSKGASTKFTDPSRLVPITCHPFSIDLSKNRIIFAVDKTSITSRAPEEALLTTGLNGAEFFAHTTTPSTPRK
jgi:hypothetical protein